MGERLSLIFLLPTIVWGRFSILTRKTENQRVRYLPPPWSQGSSGSKMSLIVPRCQTASITLSLEKQALLLDNDPGGGVEVKTPVARHPAYYVYTHTHSSKAYTLHCDDQILSPEASSELCPKPQACHLLMGPPSHSPGTFHSTKANLELEMPRSAIPTPGCSSKSLNVSFSMLQMCGPLNQSDVFTGTGCGQGVNIF